MAKLLVERGADVNIHGWGDSRTPLFIACGANNIPFAHYITAMGACH